MKIIETLNERLTTLSDKRLDDVLNFINSFEVDKLTDEVLIKKLESIGNNPIEEPKLYDALDKSGIISLALEIFSEREIEKFDGLEFAFFLNKVNNRITSFTDDDESIKSTPNTENCVLPNFIEIEKVSKSLQDSIMCNDIYENCLKSGISTEEALKNLEDALEKSRKICLNISKLNVLILTDWEKSLICNNIYRASTNMELASMGKL